MGYLFKHFFFFFTFKIRGNSCFCLKKPKKHYFMVVPKCLWHLWPWYFGPEVGGEWTRNFGHKEQSFLRLGHLKIIIYKHTTCKLSCQIINFNSYNTFKYSDIKKNLNKVQPNQFYLKYSNVSLQINKAYSLSNFRIFAIIPRYLTAPNPPPPSHSSASLVPQTV